MMTLVFFQGGHGDVVTVRSPVLGGGLVMRTQAGGVGSFCQGAK